MDVLHHITTKIEEKNAILFSFQTILLRN
ncbi:unnamed protein product, partial [Rotaria magnacalcarata]